MSHLMQNPSDCNLFAPTSIRMNPIANREKELRFRDEENVSIVVEKGRSTTQPSYVSSHLRTRNNHRDMVETASMNYLRTLFRTIPNVMGSESDVYTGNMKKDVKYFVTPYQN